MAFLTRSELQRVPVFNTKALREHHYHRKTASVREHIFLSHSHTDSDIVDQVVETLGNQGISIYVDWKDSTMPEVTSAVTATRIKIKIKECPKFVLLATNNALASRWVPWELGVADADHGMNNIVILPVVESSGTWKGNEYVGIYDRIETDSKGGLSVFAPGRNDGGISLKDWLAR